MKTWEKASGKKKEFATANWGRRREENGWILAPFSPEEMAPIQTGNNMLMMLGNIVSDFFRKPK